MFHKPNQVKVNILWTLFFISLFTIGIHLANRLLNLGLNQEITERLMLLFPAVLLILHSTFTLGINKAFGFICLATLVGLIMEILGLQTGVIFGGNYIYQPSYFMLFNVPLIVPLYWAVFTYTSYCITNSFLYWMTKQKPSKHSHKLLSLIPLIFLDGLFTVFIDLIMDPIQVYAGTWTWLDKGIYFGIPTGNFIGWFIVTIMITGIFRTYEYFFPKPNQLNNSIFMIPVIGYGAMSLALAASAINIGFNSLAIISLLTMLPISLISAGLFLKYTIVNHQLTQDQL